MTTGKRKRESTSASLSSLGKRKIRSGEEHQETEQQKSKEEKNQPNVMTEERNTTVSSTSREMVPQTQLPQLQPNPAGNQAQQGQFTANMHYWPPPPPPQGPYHLPGMNLYGMPPALPLLGAVSAGLQVPGAIGGASSSGNPPLAPGLSYHYGYPYPMFAGPPDFSHFSGQPTQPQPPWMSMYPQPYFTSLPPPTHGSSVNYQEGNIRPPTRLSQKHQKHWDAQYLLNHRLWTMIGYLQTEVLILKGHIAKLQEEISGRGAVQEKDAAQVARQLGADYQKSHEEEIPSQREVEETLHAQVSGTNTSRQKSKRKSKRGRPKKSVSAFGEHQPQPQGRKPRTSSFQPETRVIKFEKVTLRKVDNDKKVNNSVNTTQLQSRENIQNANPGIGDGANSRGSYPTMSALFNQVTEGIATGQVSSAGISSTYDVNAAGYKNDNLRTSYSALIHHINNNDISPTYVGFTNSGNIGWPSHIFSEDAGRNEINMINQSLLGNSCIIGHDTRFISGLGSTNQGEQEDLGDAGTGSSSNGNGRDAKHVEYRSDTSINRK